MKKYSLGLAMAALVAACAVAFTACDTTLDPNPQIVPGYNSVTVTFNPIELQKNYNITVDGSGVRLVPKDVETVELEIFRRSDNVSVFKEQVAAGPVEIIQPIDKELGIADNYMGFTPSGLWPATAPYEFRFGEWPLTSGTLNYIPVAELPGEVTVVDTQNGNAELFSYDLTSTSPASLNLLPVGADLVPVPEDDEPEPTDPNKAKVRFLFTGEDAFSNAEEVVLNLHFAGREWDWVVELPATYSLTLKKGEISEYVELDFTDFQMNKYFFDFSDTSGNAFSYYATYYDAMQMYVTSGSTVKYKKATLQITDDAINAGTMTLIEGLSVEW